MSRSTHVVLAGSAAGLAVLGLAPLVNWIPSDLVATWYVPVAASWVSGSLLVVGIGVLAALLLRRSRWGQPTGLAERVLAPFDPARGPALIGIGLLAGVLYAIVALTVFDGRPLHVDEIVQAIMSRSYAAGRLSEPTDSMPAFRSLLHLVEHDGRTFGHFPPGGPAWLAAWELIRTPWLAGPLAGAISVVAFGLVLRWVEPGASVRAAALLLFAITPFGVFLAGSHMNHTPALMWALLGVAALIPALREVAPQLAWSVASGLAFGMLAATRPADAIAWVGAAAIWLVASRRLAPRLVVGSLVGLLIPVGAMLAVNAATTGGPFEFAYQLAWGPGVGLGFHETPWGPPHTPLRGLELINLYLLRLNVYLFESPMPAMLAALAALALTRCLRTGDGLLLGVGIGLLAVYFAYWHDGFYLGPRFLHGLLPVLVLWTARLPSVLRERAGAGWKFAERAVVFGAIAAGLVAVWSVPERTRQYASGLASLRWDVDRAAARDGVRDAVVFVQESWGSGVLARLWALGVPKARSERLYRNVDTCRLDEAVAALEAAQRVAGGGSLRLDEVLAALVPLMADSARVVPTNMSPDRSERMQPGTRYGRRCMHRVLEDQRGVTLLAPHLLSRRADLLFARNLHQQNAALLEQYPSRSVYLLRHGLNAPEPEFRRLDRDSVLLAGYETNRRK